MNTGEREKAGVIQVCKILHDTDEVDKSKLFTLAFYIMQLAAILSNFISVGQDYNYVQIASATGSLMCGTVYLR